MRGDDCHRATLAVQARARVGAATIISSDKDLMQLVGGGASKCCVCVYVCICPVFENRRGSLRPLVDCAMPGHPIVLYWQGLMNGQASRPPGSGAPLSHPI